MGIGGTPEGVISAAALKCVGGAIQGSSGRATTTSGGGSSRRDSTSTTCWAPTTSSAADNVFVAATGVTTGNLLRGVRYVRDGAITDSISMRSLSGTVRRVEARHRLQQLTEFTGREYR